MKIYLRLLVLGIYLFLFSFTRIYALSLERKSVKDDVLYPSYRGLVMAGYQAWFTTDKDGSKRAWTHYYANRKDENGKRLPFGPGAANIEFWPDVREYEKVYQTPFVFKDGRPAFLFSSADESTIDLHFRWMKEYGIDGCFLQLFLSNVINRDSQRDKIFELCLKAAKKYDRAFALMYDLSGLSNEEHIKAVAADWNKKVKQVEKYIKDKSLDNAIISLKELLKINPASQEVKEKLEDAKIQINSALNINNIEKYSELQSHILKYEKCLQDVSNQNYKEADRLIKGLISSFPDNQVFIDLSHDIKNKLINYLHKLSLQNINDGNFEEAQKKIKQIIKMNPDNEEEYQSLLDMANNQMVNIKTCNIGAILTLEGFNESKAKQFIKEREIINWYDLESFGEYFNLQPHEIIGNSDRIIFPLKPQVKKGRAVEF